MKVLGERPLPSASVLTLEVAVVWLWDTLEPAARAQAGLCRLEEQCRV